MRYFLFISLLLVALSLAGCAARLVNTQVAQNYTSDPRRVFVIDSIDQHLGASVSAAFRAGMRDRLARCGIVSADFKPDALELNNTSRGHAERAAFNPDLMLRIETRHTKLTQYTENTTYWVGAWEISRERSEREVWSTAVTTVDFPGTVDRESRGTGIAASVMERMTADGILPACTHSFQSASGTPLAEASPR